MNKKENFKIIANDIVDKFEISPFVEKKDLKRWIAEALTKAYREGEYCEYRRIMEKIESFNEDDYLEFKEQTNYKKI